MWSGDIRDDALSDCTVNPPNTAIRAPSGPVIVRSHSTSSRVASSTRACTVMRSAGAP